MPQALEAAFATATAAEWVARLGDAGVPAGPINDIAGAWAFAAGLGLEPWDDTDGVRTAHSPMRLASTPAGVRRRPPRLGAHDAEIRARLRSEAEPPGRWGGQLRRTAPRAPGGWSWGA